MTKSEYLALIDEALEGYLPVADKRIEPLVDAMKYSLMAPGKRIRPMLVLEFCRVCGGKLYEVLPFACAVEMVHTYSLIHDDLPCMDDDDYRRGRPSNHVKYGESMALLAGDALLTLAFEIILSEDNIRKVGSEKAVKAAGTLAHAIGATGMVGGQVIDVFSENKTISQKGINFMHSKKTGALITAACEIGCIIAGAAQSEIAIAKSYAEKIGLAFQIVDDVLDVTSDMESIGKMPGSDLGNNKTTYVTLLGVKNSKDEACRLIEQAKELLAGLDGNTEFLKSLADNICEKIR